MNLSPNRVRLGLFPPALPLLCSLLALPASAGAEEAEEDGPTDPTEKEGASDTSEDSSETTLEESTSEVGEAETGSDSPPRPSPLRVLAGVRMYSRSFRYTDGIWDRDPNAGYRVGEEYTIAAAAMPRAEVHWYPAAHFTGGWMANVGLVGGYEIGVGTNIRYFNQPISQDHQLYYGGLRGRFVLGSVTLGLQSTYTNHSLKISGEENSPGTGSVFPDVSYSQIEIGGDIEWRNEKVILGGHASANLILDTGEIGSSIGAPGTNPWFPATSAFGGDFGVYAGWELSKVFDLLIGTDIRAYGLDFGTKTSDLQPNGLVDATQVVFAGGATDRYISFWGGLAIHWPSPDAEVSASVEKQAEEGEPDGGGTDDDFGDFDDF